MLYNKIISEAVRARNMSYSPYSHFCVGACIETEDGELFSGCNIENAAYSPSNCAERTAIFKAVSEGHLRFRRIAITGGKRGAEPTDYVSPCGVCRQVLTEFCDTKDMEVIMAKNENDYIVKTLEELFPYGFGPDNLGKDDTSA